MARLCAVLLIKPPSSPTESLQSQATAQESAYHSIGSVLLIREHREQQLGVLLHGCANVSVSHMSSEPAPKLEIMTTHMSLPLPYISDRVPSA